MEAYRGTKGRRSEEKEDILIKDPFLMDYAKIIQSKAYRRLASKVQVLSLPDNPHIRTRAVHTDEVIAIAMMISEELGLNTHLCMAIAAGHDIGHAPYGHFGEDLLSELGKKPFKHNVNGVVIAQHIEREGKGLNLTHETLEGILYHSLGAKKILTDSNKPAEYSVVRLTDGIAYIFSDLNDVIRYNYLDKVPSWASELGFNQRERTNNVINALIRESKENGSVQFTEGSVFKNFDSLRKFMYEEIYYKIKWDMQKIILTELYENFSRWEEFKGIDPIILISLLTDREANSFGEIILKAKKPSIDQIKHFGIFEIAKYIKDKKIDYTDSDLNWR